MSMADRDGLIWFDGEMIPWREANVHVLTHSLHYGMGVFEGVRAYNTPDGTAIFRLDAHTDRLFDSAHIMGMKIPFTKEQLNEAQRAVVRENKLETAYIRPLVFYGSEGMGIRADNLKVHVVIAAWHWGAYGRRSTGTRYQDPHQLLYPSSRQHHHDPCQGQRCLHELHAGTAGSGFRRC